MTRDDAIKTIALKKLERYSARNQRVSLETKIIRLTREIRELSKTVYGSIGNE